MDFKTFTKFCNNLSGAIKSQDREYLKSSIQRFYQSYKMCSKYIGCDTKVLSIGVGCAYVEAALKMQYNNHLTVMDFPECIELNRNHYESRHFQTYNLDLNDITNIILPGVYDVILCFEIIEHLQIAPSILFNALKKNMNTDAKLIISTPNLGSLSHIRNLLLMRPILPPPEESLGPSSYQNEGAHRREYLPVEIRNAMNINKIRVIKEMFVFNHNPQKIHECLEYPLELLVPRFRPTQLLVGVNKTDD